MVSDARDYPSESFVKVSRNNLRNPSKTSPFLNVCSWRTWRFLMNLEVVSDDRDHPSEASVKVSSKSNLKVVSDG